MAVILKPKDYQQWLDEKEKDTDKLRNLLVSFPTDEMKSHAVSRMVNAPTQDDDNLVKPLNSA